MPLESDIKASEITAYAVPSSSKESPEGMKEKQKVDPKMALACKSCHAEFDSTFSVEDFVTLSKEQYEAGTLHLCPFCGNLSIYELKDYHEPVK
ncbi:MAG: hypothetical protein OK439_07020 [Thaumarchaeota archaeon]|nr:hypothetical protein [Nitrososphaerota archaeon]